MTVVQLKQPTVLGTCKLSGPKASPLAPVAWLRTLAPAAPLQGPFAA